MKVPVLLRAHAGKHRCGVFMNIITMQYSKDTLFHDTLPQSLVISFSQVMPFLQCSLSFGRNDEGAKF